MDKKRETDYEKRNVYSHKPSMPRMTDNQILMYLEHRGAVRAIETKNKRSEALKNEQ